MGEDIGMAVIKVELGKLSLNEKENITFKRHFDTFRRWDRKEIVFSGVYYISLCYCLFCGKESLT